MKMIKECIKKTAILCVIVLGFTMCLTGCGSSQEQASQDEEGNLTTCFQGTDFEGKEVTGDILQNSGVSVINIWAIDCGPCVEEIPSLDELSREYDPEDVQFIGVCYGSLGLPYIYADGDEAANIEEDAADILKLSGAEYCNIFPGEVFMDEFIYDNVQAFPFTIITDKEGNILQTVTGAKSKGSWKKIIDEAKSKI